MSFVVVCAEEAGVMRDVQAVAILVVVVLRSWVWQLEKKLTSGVHWSVRGRRGKAGRAAAGLTLPARAAGKRWAGSAGPAESFFLFSFCFLFSYLFHNFCFINTNVFKQISTTL